MDEELGVVYVATKAKRYLDEACESRRSLRHHCPALPATLFTDQAAALGDRAGLFEQVVEIESAGGLHSAWAEGQLDRLRCLARSPYARTLQLDTDTRVLSPRLAEIGSLLEAHDIVVAEAEPESSFSCAHFGPMYHLAATGYRRCDKVERLFAALIELVEESFALGSAETPAWPDFLDGVADRRPETLRRLLLTDQVSLARLLSPEVNRFDLAVAVLPRGWLAQQGEGEASSPTAEAVLLHGAGLKQRPPDALPYRERLSLVFPTHLLWRRFEEVGELNKALARLCLKLCDRPNDGSKAAIGARRSLGNLFDRPEPEVRLLKRMIDDAVLRYLREALPALQPPGNDDLEVLIDGWAYVMEPGDMLTPHLHRDGVVTGTYYVELPDRGDEGAQPGRLVLQHPSPAAAMIRAPRPLIDRQTLEAEAGELLLFPSYLPHYVPPFRQGRRIAISFDVALRKKGG